MPQDRESGARANAYGRETAKKIAVSIGAKSISATSNEFELQGRKITIRCARRSTSDLGVTYKMLKRIDGVFAALEQKNGKYEVFELSPNIFEKNMRETKSKGASAGKVGMVRKSIFIDEGKFVGSTMI